MECFILICSCIFRNNNIFFAKMNTHLFKMHTNGLRKSRIMIKINEWIYNFCLIKIHIGRNHFWIVGNQWTIIMVIRLMFIYIIGHTWIENHIHTFINQLLNMSVHNFSRKTCRITRNALLS